MKTNASNRESKLETLQKSGEQHKKTDKTEEEHIRDLKIIDKILNVKTKDAAVFNNLINDVNIENKLVDIIDKTTTKMGVKNITSPREESETHKLIDSREYQKLIKDNQELKKQRDVINFQYNELVKENFKVEGELNFLKSMAESQEKNKKDGLNKIKEANKTNAIMKDANKKLQSVLLIESTEKDNIFRAILSSITRSDDLLGKEFKNMYTSFNNQDFLFKANDEEDKIENLMGKIKAKEKEISEKKFELNGLKKFLIGDNHKNKTKLNAVIKKRTSIIKKN